MAQEHQNLTESTQRIASVSVIVAGTPQRPKKSKRLEVWKSTEEAEDGTLVAGRAGIVTRGLLGQSHYRRVFNVVGRVSVPGYQFRKTS